MNAANAASAGTASDEGAGLARGAGVTARAVPRGERGDGRERVLTEAHRLFTAQGFAEVSMQQVADAAGMTKAALYYHFRDKSDLFGQVVLREMERVRSGIVASLAASETLRAQLEGIAHYVLVSVQADLGRLMTELHEHVPVASREAIKARICLPYDLVHPCLAQAAQRGELRPGTDVDQATLHFFGMVLGCLKSAEMGHPAKLSPEAAAASITDTLLHGIAAG
jgi:AcrR family transcriptional regulator